MISKYLSPAGNIVIFYIMFLCGLGVLSEAGGLFKD